MFREMRRFKQQVTDEECISILEKGKRGILAVLGDEGYPYTVPMDFVYEDGHIYFHSAASGHKLDSIRKNDKVSFCVLSDGVQEENDWWFHFTSVVAFGKIRVIEDDTERRNKLRLLGAKYFPTAEYLEKEMSGSSADRVLMLDLCIEHMTGKKVREN
jgi:nitroimidazol reductase NimA-like FMN-containing flavoprotein (pyridoxamine 5'-phosphate oxidase superfamily)